MRTLSHNLTDPASSPPEYQTAPGPQSSPEEPVRPSARCRGRRARERGRTKEAAALTAGRRARRLSPGDAASRRPEPECEEPGVWEARGPPVRRRGSAHIRVSAGIARAKMQEPNRPRRSGPGPPRGASGRGTPPHRSPLGHARAALIRNGPIRVVPDGPRRAPVDREEPP
jgi:hypothetical protein